MPAKTVTTELPLAEGAAPATLVEATVKRGTVVAGDGEHVGPGGVVNLPPADVARLIADGVLVDPEDKPLAIAGPTVSAG